MQQLSWNTLDVILVTGDTYIDSPFSGIAIIGKVLLQAGYHVGIIAQPDIYSDHDITRLGEPELFWGVTGGAVDSMVANYTALKKKRKTDDFTPGGLNSRRPDRAVIVYSQLIQKYFKRNKPIVLGGIEASLRRIAHYDYWSNSIRRSILFDAKADILVYGMGEKQILAIANQFSANKKLDDILGICYISSEKKDNYLELPSYTEVRENNDAFIQMFHDFYIENDPLHAQGILQKQDTRYLVHNPPSRILTTHELDQIYQLDFERSVHPYYRQWGEVKAIETIQFSIPIHRGCYGDCSFCAISMHEGKTVSWRSHDSIIEEARRITYLPNFKGHIFDISGPTANMYGYECKKKKTQGACRHKHCLYPAPCNSLPIDHRPQIELLQKLRNVKNIKKICLGSAMRDDLVMHDKKNGQNYLREIVQYHVCGQLKIAPEHISDHVLSLMKKPSSDFLNEFKRQFDRFNQTTGKKQYLTYYFIAAHPGCTIKHMLELRQFVIKHLHIIPEQVQIFTPTPSTHASVMYYTGINTETHEPIFVEKNLIQKAKQKSILTQKNDSSSS